MGGAYPDDIASGLPPPHKKLILFSVCSDTGIKTNLDRSSILHYDYITSPTVIMIKE